MISEISHIEILSQHENSVKRSRIFSIAGFSSNSYPLEEFRALLYNNVRQRDYLAPNGYEVEVGSL